MLDLKYAVRQLSKSPGFTSVAILSLGLCIGANLTIFAVLDAIVVRALPFPEPDRLVVVHNAYPAMGIERGKATIGDYYDRRKAIEAFESIAMFQERPFVIGEAGSTRLVEVGLVTPDFFQTLGVPLAMGRAFTGAELDYGSSPIAILTDRFWRTHFESDPNVLGRTFMRDGLSATVVGVLPSNFRYLSSKVEIYFPLGHFPKHRVSPGRHTQRARRHDGQMIARLAPHASTVDANSQLSVLNARLLADDPMAKGTKDKAYHSWVAPLHADHISSVKPILMLLQSGVLCLLLIGSVNLAGLLMIRASGREKEIAVRKALGAGRGHLACQVLIETLMLSLGGGVVGVLLGVLGLRLIEQLGTGMLPLGANISFDGRIAIASIIASVAVCAGIAIPLIWINQRDTSNVSLNSETRGGTSSRSVQRVRHTFVVAQIAIAFILLCGASLLSVSLKRALENSPGFEVEHVLTGGLSLPWRDYGPDSSRVAFVRSLLDRLRAQPGIKWVAISSALPFTNAADAPTTVLADTSEPGAHRTLRAHHFSTVTSDYLQAMDIPLLKGRFFEDSDSGLKGVEWYDTDANGPPRVAVIDEVFAQLHWPDGDAIGRRFSTNPAAFDKRTTYTVIGIVGKVKQIDLAETEELGAAYLPYVKVPEFHVIVRSPLSANVMASTLEKVVGELDPNLPIYDISTMQTRIDDSLVMRRSPAILATVFAAVALLLAAIGIYGTLAYGVAQRRREIGVRMALGARRRQIGSQFLYMGIKLFAAGALVGTMGAWTAGRIMQSILFQVPPFHVLSLIGTAVAIALVTLIASSIPAIRASRINPMEALRSE